MEPTALIGAPEIGLMMLGRSLRMTSRDLLLIEGLNLRAKAYLDLARNTGLHLHPFYLGLPPQIGAIYRNNSKALELFHELRDKLKLMQDQEDQNVGESGFERVPIPALAEVVLGAQGVEMLVAPEMRYEMSTGGCSGMTPNGEESCHAPGGRKSGTLSLGHFSSLGVFEGDASSGSIGYKPVSPEFSASIPVAKADYVAAPIECVGPHGGGNAGTWEAGGFNFQIQPDSPESPCHPQDQFESFEQVFVSCSAPTECFRPSSPASHQECIVHGDRHAIIPFSGESSWTSPRASNPYYEGLLGTRTQWKICCGCGEGPAPPEPSSDPCPQTTKADSDIQMNRQQQQLNSSQLGQRSQQYEEELKEARSHYEDFRKLAAACLIQDLATSAMIVALAPEAEEAEISKEAAEAWEWAEQNQMVPPNGLPLIAEIAKKLVNGEDPTIALTAEEYQVFQEELTGLQKIMGLFPNANPGQMEKSLDSCAGTIGVSVATKMSADKCIEGFKAAADTARQMQQLSNDIRQLDTKLPDLQYKAWAACVNRARCEGTPESACDDKKPAGDWPAP